VPHLGVVAVDEDRNFVIADIPGLIPGASEGAGLGIQFLKHVERTRALLHLITVDPAEDRDPMKDYVALRAELKKFDAKLAKRPEVVALSKADLPEVRDVYPKLKKAFAKKKIPLFLISAATGDGVRDVLEALWKKKK
jgi:GTP-binding protein